MLIATSPQKAQEFERQMSTRTIKKEYICKVTGEFPEYVPFYKITRLLLYT
jgi:23S rRNA-/tRNA-specific pseudouridylate synthase